MNDQATGTLDASIQERIDADTDFQATLADLSDDDKAAAIATKRTEVLETEFTTLKDKAEKADKAEVLANNYKTRAEKAEAELKKNKPADTAPREDALSTADLYALMNAKVPEEDVPEVTKAAKLLGVSVPEALKDTTVQGILAKRAEHRTSAEAANSRGARAGTKTATDDEVLAAAAKGEIPERGSKEAEQLFNARRRKG